jgi:hypothetical protein
VDVGTAGAVVAVVAVAEAEPAGVGAVAVALVVEVADVAPTFVVVAPVAAAAGAVLAGVLLALGFASCANADPDVKDIANVATKHAVLRRIMTFFCVTRERASLS